MCLGSDELENFFGVLLWMSLIRLHTTRRYWSPDTRIPQVADVMTLNRFEKLKRFLHFSNNNEIIKNIDKITPVINQIRDACRKIPFEENLSCDEQIIPFKGRIGIKTYNPKKPHKWGYKMWVLSGISGFSYNFELFTGKEGSTRLDSEPDLGASSNVIVRLSRVIPDNVNHKIYYDNYFSSIPLLAFLAKRNIHSVATVRVNRLPNYKPCSDKDMKKLGRGAMFETSTRYDATNINVVQWYDNKIVSLTSTYCGSQV